jgi:predicted Co/Zn/Cd cation transporter (cation efflux family)
MQERRFFRSDEVMQPDPEQRPLPGRAAIAFLGLLLGLVLMAIQLWLLTLAFDFYLSGKRNTTVLVAVISGFIFLGGLAIRWFLDRKPGRRR